MIEYHNYSNLQYHTLAASMPKHIQTVDRFPWISLTLQLQEGPHLKVKFMDFQMCHA